MNEEKNMIPRRRFNSFNSGWMQKIFGDYFNVISGYAFNKRDYTFLGIPIINGESIQNGKIKVDNLNYLPRNFHHKYSNFLVNTDDIVLGLNRPIINKKLKISLIPKELNNSLLYQRAGKVVNVKSIHKYFSYQLLEKRIFKYVKEESVGSDQPFISTSHLSKVEFFLPQDEKEQQKIGEFFKVLDERIANQERKIAKIKALKSAYLTEMFPQEDEKVPKRRFIKNSYEWKSCKIGSLYSSIESGNRLPKTMLHDGRIPYVIATTTNNGVMMNIDQHSLDYHGNKMKLFPADSITFSIDNPEAIFLQKSPFFTSNIMRVLHREDFNIYQSTFILETLKTLTANYNWAFKFSGPVVMNSSIMLPMNDQGEINWHEIEMIGKLITNLDNQITVVKRMLEKLKKTKEAYLEEMFV